MENPFDALSVGYKFEPFIGKAEVHQRKQELTLSVKSEYWNAVADRVSAADIDGKKLNSAGVSACCRLYFFMGYMLAVGFGSNGGQTIQISLKELACAVAKNNLTQVRKYIAVLEEAKLISYNHTRVSLSKVDGAKRMEGYGRNEYYVFGFEIPLAEDLNTLHTCISNHSISISIKLSNYLLKSIFKYLKYNSSFPSSPSPSIVCSKVAITPSMSTDYETICSIHPWLRKSLSFYDELSVKCRDGEERKLIQTPVKLCKDVRLYFKEWMSMHKRDREESVLWDGEHIKEIWDAPTAFWSLLPAAVSNDDSYLESLTEDEKWGLKCELRTLLALTSKCGGTMDFYGVFEAPTGLVRKQVKECLQAYVNMSENEIIGEDGKYLKPRSAIAKIDGFFAEHFPMLRRYIIGYKARNNGDSICRPVHEIETRIISIELCKWLYEELDVKSVTVYDAIYVKECDLERVDEEQIQMKYEEVVRSSCGF